MFKFSTVHYIYIFSNIFISSLSFPLHNLYPVVFSYCFGYCIISAVPPLREFLKAMFDSQYLVFMISCYLVYPASKSTIRHCFRHADLVSSYSSFYISSNISVFIRNLKETDDIKSGIADKISMPKAVSYFP